MERSTNGTLYFNCDMYLLDKISILLDYISKIGSARFFAPSIGLSKIRYNCVRVG